MFPRQARLTDPKLFALMIRAGTWQKGRYMSLRFLPVRGGTGKISFVISKKTSKFATVRNRSKRRTRAIFQDLFRRADFSIVPQKFHLLVVIHRSLAEVAQGELSQEIEGLLRSLARKIAS